MTFEKKVELTELNKLIKKDMRKNLKVCAEKVVSQILEENWYTRKVRKEIYGIKVRVYFPNQKRRMGQKSTTEVSLLIWQLDTMKTPLLSQKQCEHAHSFKKPNCCASVREPELPILESEVFRVIKNLKQNRAPGPGGIDNELLKVFSRRRGALTNKII